MILVAQNTAGPCAGLDSNPACMLHRPQSMLQLSPFLWPSQVSLHVLKAHSSAGLSLVSVLVVGSLNSCAKASLWAGMIITF